MDAQLNRTVFERHSRRGLATRSSPPWSKLLLRIVLSVHSRENLPHAACPSLAATSMGRIPLPSRVLCGAPAANSVSTSGADPNRAAMCNAVAPYLFFAETMGGGAPGGDVGGVRLDGTFLGGDVGCVVVVGDEVVDFARTDIDFGFDTDPVASARASSADASAEAPDASAWISAAASRRIFAMPGWFAQAAACGGVHPSPYHSGSCHGRCSATVPEERAKRDV